MSNSNPQKPTLSASQLKAIPAILSARNIAEGCKKAKISRDSFYDWLKTSEFKSEFERQRQEIIDSALHELRLTANDAVRALRELLNTQEDSVRLRTATAILENIGKFVELEGIEKRLTEIERKLEK